MALHDQWKIFSENMLSSGTCLSGQSKVSSEICTVTSLKDFCWKIRCPPKIKYFLWQIVSGCIAVNKNLRGQTILGDIICARCRAAEESINHVFLNVPQQTRFVLPRRFLRIQRFSRYMHSLQTWINYS